MPDKPQIIGEDFGEERPRPHDGPRIIALGGPKTCGKDTMASVLLKQNQGLVPSEHKNYFLRTPFARGVKQICHDVFGWDWELMDDFHFKETVLNEWPHCEPRWPMMDIANWMRDRYGGDVWVRACHNFIQEQHRTNPYGAYVITDWRFPEELAWLKTQNSLLIYIDRPSAEVALSTAKALGDPKALNPSEAHYDLLKAEADHILLNDREPYKAQNLLMNMVRQRFDHWIYWS
jgi:hypothetical protein